MILTEYVIDGRTKKKKPVSELSEKSQYKILVQCDFCGEKKEIPYWQYVKSANNHDGKYCCRWCLNHNKDILEQLQNKKKQTCQKNFGVDYPMQSNVVRKKSSETVYSKHGVNYIAQVPEVMQKVIQTQTQKYGGMGRGSKTTSKKIDATNLLKYGNKLPIKNPEVMQKVIQTQTQKYGGMGLGSPIVKEKIQNAYFQKTGYYNPGENPEVHQKMLNTMTQNGTIPVSQQEEEIMNIISNKYDINHGIPSGKCILDIVINVNGILINIETDGYHWHCENKNDKLYDIRRDKFTLSNGYDKVLRIVYNHSIPSEEEILRAIEELINSEKTFKRIWSSDITEEQIEHFNNL